MFNYRLKKILRQAAWFVTATVLFVVLLRTPLLSQLQSALFRGIALLIIVALLQIAVLNIIYRRKRRIHFVTILKASLGFALITLAWYSYVLVVVQQSVNSYMLDYLADHPNTSYTSNELEQVLVEQMLQRQVATTAISEQVSIGAIHQTTDGYKITNRGIAVTSLFNTISKLIGQ